MGDHVFLLDDDWRDLLREIHNRQVIPIVGPEIVTTLDAASGQHVSLYRHLAPKLAKALGVNAEETPQNFNRIACQYLLGGGPRKAIYREVSQLLDDHLRSKPVLPPALLDLASISDFDLFISGTIDPMLALAVERQRPGFLAQEHVKAYDYRRPVDLPESLEPALVYHILGSRQTYPNFAVWEEDYLEFICGFIKHHAQLERLLQLLRSRYLLLLGVPFSDWIVRFFLFVAKGGRFSDHRKEDVSVYLTDQPENLGEPLIFFFDKVVGTTRIIRGDPLAFTHELTRRWRRECQADLDDSDLLAQIPDEMPRGSVFVSYSRDDLVPVTKLIRSLRAAQIPIWIDKQRLRAGENFERSLEDAIKNRCSFFISVVSAATESDPGRYVHRERRWAAQRHVDGFVFYIPVAIDERSAPKLEPPEFANIHVEPLPDGEVTTAFTTRLSRLVAEHRRSGQPRT